MGFVGVTRFSLFHPSSAAWRTSQNGMFKSPEEYAAYLYSDERLAPRLKIFSEISIPQLAVAAERHEIRHIVQYSPRLPEKYLRVLKDLAHANPFLILSNAEDVGDTHPLAVGESLSTKGTTYGMYRLDDDDLLSVRYFDDLADYVNDRFLGFRVSLAAGTTGIFDGKMFSAIRYSHKPNIAIGLASIQGRNTNGKYIAPPAGSHNHADRLGPVIVDSRQCAYFWTRHEGQDTNFGRVNDFMDTRSEVEAQPPVPDGWSLQELFPAMAAFVGSSVKTVVDRERLIDSSGEEWQISATGRFSIEIDATYAEGMKSNSALISFHFNETGTQPNDLEAPYGMSKSYYSEIGWYRYLITYPGRRTQELEFELPTGAEVDRIRIMPFGADGAPFQIHSLRLNA